MQPRDPVGEQLLHFRAINSTCTPQPFEFVLHVKKPLPGFGTFAEDRAGQAIEDCGEVDIQLDGAIGIFFQRGLERRAKAFPALDRRLVGGPAEKICRKPVAGSNRQILTSSTSPPNGAPPLRSLPTLIPLGPTGGTAANTERATVTGTPSTKSRI